MGRFSDLDIDEHSAAGVYTAFAVCGFVVGPLDGWVSVLRYVN